MDDEIVYFCFHSRGLLFWTKDEESKKYIKIFENNEKMLSYMIEKDFILIMCDRFCKLLNIFKENFQINVKTSSFICNSLFCKKLKIIKIHEFICLYSKNEIKLF